MSGARRRARPGILAAALVSVLGVMVTWPARANAQPEPAPWVIIVDDDDTAALQIAARVQDLLAAPPGVRLKRARQLVREDIFRPDTETEGPHPTAWVVVNESLAQVRAASAARDRFVFRDLVVSRPLTELDRERLGLTLKSAPQAVLEGGAQSLDRRAAEATFVAPPSAAADHPIGEARTDADAPAKPAPPSSGEAVLTWSLAALYEVLWTSWGVSGLNGPGLAARLDVSGWSIVSVGLWSTVTYFTPVRLGIWNFDMGYGPSVRAGVGLQPLPRIELEVGGGFDWLQSAGTSGGPGRLSLARLAVRVGPVSILGERLSATAIFEHSDQAFGTGSVYNGMSSNRGGLSLDIQLR